MEETAVQIDGKTVFVAPGKVLQAVVIPGKVVNLITKISDPSKLKTHTVGYQDGEDGVFLTKSLDVAHRSLDDDEDHHETSAIEGLIAAVRQWEETQHALGEQASAAKKTE